MKGKNIPIAPDLHEELRQLRISSGGVPISVLANHSIRTGLAATKEKFLPRECLEMAQSKESINQ